MTEALLSVYWRGFTAYPQAWLRKKLFFAKRKNIKYFFYGSRMGSGGQGGEDATFKRAGNMKGPGGSVSIEHNGYFGRKKKEKLSLLPAKCSVVNKQTESHKVSIFYLHEVKLVHNAVRHSPHTLLPLSRYLSGFFGVLLRLQKSTHPTRVWILPY